MGTIFDTLYKQEEEVSIEGFVDTMANRSGLIKSQMLGAMALFSSDEAKSLLVRLVKVKDRIDKLSEEKSIPLPKQASALMVGNDAPSSANDLMDCIESFSELHKAVFIEFQPSIKDALENFIPTGRDFTDEKYWEAFNRVEFEALRKYCPKTVDGKKTSDVLPGNHVLKCKLDASKERVKKFESMDDVELGYMEVYDVEKTAKSKVSPDDSIGNISVSDAKKMIAEMERVLNDFILNKKRMSGAEFMKHMNRIAMYTLSTNGKFVDSLAAMYVTPAGRSRRAIYDGFEAIVVILDKLISAKAPAEESGDEA